MTQILKLKYVCVSVSFILNSLPSHDSHSCFYRHLGKFEMTLSSLISVKFMIALRLTLQQWRRLALMEGPFNSFWTVCHLGRWPSVKPTPGLVPGSSIRLVSRLLLTLLTLLLLPSSRPLSIFDPCLI